MRKHCCNCGAKSPPQVRGSHWISFRADNDPLHYLCPDCKKLPGNEKLMAHMLDWRKGVLGCRISPDSNTKLFSSNADFDTQAT